MVAVDQQVILSKKLALLLGFGDDGGAAADILEHLLTIESSEDLLDYLTQLLGNEKDGATRAFVEDVGRVQRGEILTDVEEESSPPFEEIKKKSPEQTVPVVNQTKRAPPRKEGAPKAKEKQTVQLPNSNSDAESSIKTMDTGRKSNEPQKEELESSRSKTSAKAPPPRGKAEFECGCFGSLHAALTNCLFCGRILCEKEGYEFCPFCGYLVEEVKPVDGDAASKDEAWKHKERLLRYDREFAQRTVILDDQADYYNQTTSTWLTDDEQEAAAKDEQQRHDDIHKRKNMQLNLGI